MNNINSTMQNFKLQLERGDIQKAYLYIFRVFSDLTNTLKNIKDKNLYTNALYHGYLDMTYLPIITDTLKQHGLKVAVVFNYAPFGFELWLSAVNHKKRDEICKLINDGKWQEYKTVSSKENPDAIIVVALPPIKNYEDRQSVVSAIADQATLFIDKIEYFLNKELQCPQ